MAVITTVRSESVIGETLQVDLKNEKKNESPVLLDRANFV